MFALFFSNYLSEKYSRSEIIYISVFILLFGGGGWGGRLPLDKQIFHHFLKVPLLKTF